MLNKNNMAAARILCLAFRLVEISNETKEEGT
jgi:hypothetical protein